MISEQHERLIDQLFKQVNLRGAGVEQGSGEGGTGPGAGKTRGRKTVEHADPFAVEAPSDGQPQQEARVQGLGGPPINSSS
ncbi:MAG: hypothetical protein HQL98_02675 [Magnetococcales bacterium]|nr:hypothetical protein [Magnetococcales bacterium]